jgi:hypothetical protein
MLLVKTGTICDYWLSTDSDLGKTVVVVSRDLGGAFV